jgi:hypothetical protein
MQSSGVLPLTVVRDDGRVAQAGPAVDVVVDAAPGPARLIGPHDRVEDAEVAAVADPARPVRPGECGYVPVLDACEYLVHGARDGEYATHVTTGSCARYCPRGLIHTSGRR